VAQRYRP